MTAATARVEAAVTEETARALRIGVGAEIHVPGVERPPVTVRVTGILAPREPDGPYWGSQPLLRTPALTPTPGSQGRTTTGTGSAPCCSRPRPRPCCWARPAIRCGTGSWPRPTGCCAPARWTA
ncbi:hypothetical protein SFUMM280S_04103 [Streptomyces fumanus]